MGAGSGLTNPIPDVIAPATRFVVELGTGGATGGMLVRSIVWRAGDQPSYAEIELATARFQQFGGIAPNMPVKITAHLTGGAAIVLFVGRVSGRGAEYSDRSESAFFTALGPRWDLSKDYVLGREVAAFAPSESGDPATPELHCLTALPCIFNDGRGNRASDAIDGDRAFHPDPRIVPAAENEWDLASMLEYLYRQRKRERRYEYRTLGEPVSANVVGDPLGAATTFGHAVLVGRVVYGVNVDGLNLLAAFHTVLESGGMRWWVRPVGLGSSGPEGELRATPKVFVEGVSVGHKLHLPAVDNGVLPAIAVSNPSLATASGRRANNNQGRIQEDFSRVYDSVMAAGGPVTFQFEFDLKPGWRTLDEESLLGVAPGEPPELPPSFDLVHDVRLGTAEQSSASWNPDPEDPAVAYYRDVGRLWILDETGYETDRAGRDPFDWLDGAMDPLGLIEPIAVRPRPAMNSGKGRPAPVDGAPGTVRVVPVQLEVFHPSIESGLVGQVVNASWSLDPERAGLWVTDEVISKAPFWDDATATWASKVRISLQVESDFLMQATASDAGSPVSARLLVKGEREYRSDGDTTAAADALLALAGSKLAANIVPVRSASFTIPWVAPGYEIGHWLTGITGRDVEFIGQIVEVRFQGQDTHITLEDTTVFLGRRR